MFFQFLFLGPFLHCHFVSAPMGADDGKGEGMWLSIKAFWLKTPNFIIMPFRTPRFIFLSLSLIACHGTEADRLKEAGG